MDQEANNTVENEAQKPSTMKRIGNVAYACIPGPKTVAIFTVGAIVGAAGMKAVMVFAGGGE